MNMLSHSDAYFINIFLYSESPISQIDVGLLLDVALNNLNANLSGISRMAICLRGFHNERFYNFFPRGYFIPSIFYRSAM